MNGPGFGPRERDAAARLLDLALAEDGVDCDRTTQVAVPDDRHAAFDLRARAAGVVAGGPLVAMTLERIDPSVVVSVELGDGETCGPGQAIVSLEGRLAPILTAERTFLNLMGLLGGTATLTRRFVDAVGPGCSILDTRKTWPGARVLQKYAVRCGGGTNHRFGLDDAILLKDNHLDDAPSWEALVRRAREHHPGIFLETEVDTLEQLEAVLPLGVDRILLDNFDPGQVRQAVARRDQLAPGLLLEVSGGVTLETAPALAAAGADFLSVGALTHSAPCLDLGLDRR